MTYFNRDEKFYTLKPEEIRLECLKLATARAVDTSEILAKAKAYEAYVLEPQSISTPAEKEKIGKKGKSGNLDSLI